MSISKHPPRNLPDDERASWDYAQIWDKFPVPARPSKEELLHLKGAIKKQHSHDNVLILGSTIEYRSIAKVLGITPHVADFERSHYEILTKYAKEEFKNEHFLEVDWLDMKDENAYDAIIGHRAVNVVGCEVLNRFFDRMHRALKPGGIFYCKGNIRKDDDPDRLDRLIDEWAFKGGREYPLFSYIEVALYFRCADKNGYVDYSVARQVVNGWKEAGRISREDYDLIKLLVSMSEEARFRGTIYENEIRSAIQASGFAHQEWLVLDKDICQNMPIIQLTK